MDAERLTDGDGLVPAYARILEGGRLEDDPLPEFDLADEWEAIKAADRPGRGYWNTGVFKVISRRG